MAIALKRGGWSDLDVENLVEEIESLGRSEKRALKSRLEVLLMHLLKWEYQPEHRCNSWQATITEQRLRIQDLIAESPSLKPYLQTEQARCYANARQLAAAKTGLTLTTFPEVCPYALPAILTTGFLPGEAT